MKNLIRLLLFTLGLPVLAAAMSWACISKLDDSLRDQVHRQYPKVTAEELGQITVSSLAAQGGFDATAELPVIYRYLVYARTTAIASGVIGLVLIGAISYAGRVTLKRRDLLLRIFRPGVFVTLSVVGVLTAAQALSVAYAAYYFESLYIERVHMILIIGISVGGVLAFVAVVRALFSLKASSGFNALAQSVTPAEQPALWETVRQVCAELNATPPDNIVLGIEPSFTSRSPS